jgi:hypothetical protein
MLAILLFVVLNAAATVPAVIPARSQSKVSTPAREEFDKFQIPAGTALLLKLQTTVDSASANVDDQVEARLWSPVIQDDRELIPVDSVMSGKITAVVRASKRTPVGSVTFVLSVVQHARTRDRAMLPTERIVIEAPVPATPRGGSAKKMKPADAAMTEGATFVAVTSQPLIVRIPK